MSTLSKELRRQLENTVLKAREEAERGAAAALESFGVADAKLPGHLDDAGKNLRRKLRAHGRQVGDVRRPDDSQEVTHLIHECAYEHWHRMLFARFLAENGFLIEPESGLDEGLNLFRAHEFTKWGGPRQSFWGFAMMFLAALHGKDDWEAMKQGKMVEILDSFAWGNGNAVELYSDRQAWIKVPPPYWESIRRAGEPLNRFRHIHETLRPDVVVVMYRGIHIPTYFEGYHLETVTKEGRLAHYRLPEAGVDIFHVPHPGSMNRIEGTDYFRDKLKELFVAHGFTSVFGNFLAGQEEGKKAVAYLHAKAPAITQAFDKYAFVSWVAEELTKRDAFMSVPALMELVNAKGGETNYGTAFTGGRGSYRLVSGAYWRLENTGQHDRAHNVAVAFRRPNFEYAYETD